MNRFKAEIGGVQGAPNRGERRVDRERMGEMITVFVRDLPQRQREVFQMSELQGLSSPEIGKILDLEPGSVRAALLKARRSLRLKILEKHPEFVEEYLS